MITKIWKDRITKQEYIYNIEEALKLEDFIYDINGNEINYEGNIRLRPAKCVIPYTKEHLKEIIKCSRNIKYFATNYIKLITLDKGLTKPNLYPFQLYELEQFVKNRFVILKCSRQTFKTSTTGIFLLHQLLFRKDITIAILANKEETAKEILRRIKIMYENLPKWLQQGIISWAQTKIECENGSRIIASSTSSSAVRGYTVNILYVDECVKGDTYVTVKNKKTGKIEIITMEELYARCKRNSRNRYEVLTENGFKDFKGIKKIKKEKYIKITFNDNSILECSFNHKIKIKPNIFKYAFELEVGDITTTNLKIIKIEKFYCEDYFYDLIDVEDGNEYITNNVTSHNCAFIPQNVWNEFYQSVYPTISSGNTSKIIISSTPKGLNQFYKFWTDALKKKNAFYPIEVFYYDIPERDEKWVEQMKKNVDDLTWRQEYECDFLGSQDTLIKIDVLLRLTYEDELQKHKLYEYLSDYKQFLHIYKDKEKNAIYSIGVDTSKMTKHSSNDSFSIQVVRIDKVPFEQVLHFYADKDFYYLDSPFIIDTIQKYYGECYIFIENNETGQEIANILAYDFGNEFVYFEKNNLPGFRTTKKTKRIGCQNLKLLIEKDKLIIKDFITLSQLSTFVKKGMSYEADDGFKDDAVMSLIASIFFMQTKDFQRFNIFENKKQLIQQISQNKIENKEFNQQIIKREESFINDFEMMSKEEILYELIYEKGYVIGKNI